MDSTLLVEKYINQGKIFIRNLDANNIKVDAALWFYDSDSKTWKLIIATPKYDQEGALKVYQQIENYLPHEGENHISLQDISVVSPHDYLISILRSAIKTPVDAIADIKFNDNTINNKYIEGAYIYRLT